MARVSVHVRLCCGSPQPQGALGARPYARTLSEVEEAMAWVHQPMAIDC